MLRWLAGTIEQSLTFWPYVVTLLNVVLSLAASGHAVLSKRDTRAAIGWVGVIWLAPILGVLLYVWLGINRIERRARSLREGRPRLGWTVGPAEYRAEVPDQADSLSGTPLEPLVKLVRDVTRQPLLAGNQVTPLLNGDRAYPAMLEAIDAATKSVALSTYIFALPLTNTWLLRFRRKQRPLQVFRPNAQGWRMCHCIPRSMAYDYSSGRVAFRWTAALPEEVSDD